MLDGLPNSLMRLTRDLMQPDGLRHALRDLVGRARAPLAPATPFAAAAAGRPADIAGFGSNPGELRMALYVPTPPPPSGAPLVVVLHGCTQSALPFAAESGWTALADRLRIPLLLPEQVAGNNPQRCFNWFRPEDVARGAGEGESIRQMVVETAIRFGSDPRRIFVVGLSAGGAMAAAMLAAYPDIFAGGAAVAGLPVGTAHDIPSALTRMARGSTETHSDTLADRARAVGPAGYAGAWPSLSVWHGTADHTVDPQNADHLVAQWTALHGIAGGPSSDVRRPDGVRRRVWGRAGRPPVELWTIERMGHGFPVAGGRPADTFVLDVGVPAAEEIARFWGLLPALAPA